MTGREVYDLVAKHLANFVPASALKFLQKDESSDVPMDDATADISSSEDLDNISTPADTPVTIRSQRENLHSPHFSHSPAAYYSQSNSSSMHKKFSDSFQKPLDENAAKALSTPEKLESVLERLPEMAAAAKAAAAVPYENQQPEASMKPASQGKAAPAERMGNALEQVRSANAGENSSMNSGVNSGVNKDQPEKLGDSTALLAACLETDRTSDGNVADFSTGLEDQGVGDSLDPTGMCFSIMHCSA